MTALNICILFVVSLQSPRGMVTVMGAVMLTAEFSLKISLEIHVNCAVSPLEMITFSAANSWKMTSKKYIMVSLLWAIEISY